MAEPIKVEPENIDEIAEAMGVPVKILRMAEVVRKRLVNEYRTPWVGKFLTTDDSRVPFTLMNEDMSFVFADLTQYSCAGEMKTMIEIALNYPAINDN